MGSGKEGFLWRYKWHLVVICIAVAIVVVLTLYTDLFQPTETNLLRQLVLLLGALVFLSALLAMLSRVIKILDALRDNSAKLQDLTGALEKIHTGLAQINHSTRISEAAKAIAFRDADRQSLREVVFEKLQMQDYNAAKDIINEIANHTEYIELAEELRLQAEQYHNATDQERLNQIIEHIEKLIDECQWSRASAQIEGQRKGKIDASSPSRQETGTKKNSSCRMG